MGNHNNGENHQWFALYQAALLASNPATLAALIYAAQIAIREQAQALWYAGLANWPNAAGLMPHFSIWSYCQ